MPVKYVTCTCAELGCNKKQYREGHQLRSGRKMCEAAFKTHEEAIRNCQSCVIKDNSDLVSTERPSRNTQIPHPISAQVPLPPSSSDCDNKQVVNTYKWSPISFNSLHRHALAVLVQTASGSLLEGRSEKDLNRSLQAEKEKIKMSSLYKPSEIKEILKQIPSTLKTVFNKLGLEPEIIWSVCCPTCFALYPLPPDPTKKAKLTEGSTTNEKTPRVCSAQFFSQSKTYVKSLPKDAIPQCSAKLFKKDTKPCRIFTHQTLKSWLSRVLWRPNFEDLLDSPLNQPPWSPENEMHDVWDGLVWNTFQDPTTPGIIYTSASGNLVFSLYVDWFNPYHSNRKHASIGAITLVCLNLPPWERYKEENIYIYAIIPGPSEPSLDEMNHVLNPLVDELQIFCKGIWFNQTFRHRNGRFIKAVVFPLIADLPALRKTAGFSGHSANLFCSFCKLTLKEIECINPRLFPARVHEDHIATSIEWKEAKTHADRKKIFDQHGGRYSILNSLTYWRPVEYCSIDLMHALLLGNIKDYCMNYLKLSEAGEHLSKQKEKRRHLALRSNTEDVFFMLELAKDTEQPSGPLKRSREVDTQNQDHASGSQMPLQHKRSKKIISNILTESENRSTPERLAHPQSTRPMGQSKKYNLRPRRIHLHSTQLTQQSLQLNDSKVMSPSAQKSIRLQSPSEIASASQCSSYKQSSVRLENVSPGESHSKISSQFLKSGSATSTHDAMECDCPSDTSTEKGTARQSNDYPSASTNKGKGKAPAKRKPVGNKEKRKAQAAEEKRKAAEEKKKKEALWPRLLPEELEAIHLAILNTEVPSTITRTPKLIGTPGNRTLKAAEWHILVCVYFPLVLVPMWYFSAKTHNRNVMLKTMTNLIGITNILSARSISNRQSAIVEELLMEYRNLLSKHWLGSETKPNLHLSQHFPEVISRFGPPASTAAWAQERLNGTLGKISTNNHLFDMNKTILSQWSTKSQFLSLLHGHGDLLSDIPEELRDIFLKTKSNVKGKEFNLSDECYSKWVQLVRSWGDLARPVSPTASFLLYNSTELDKKTYSTLSKHGGNSTIRYVHETRLHFGQIETVFTCSEFQGHIFFVVLPLKKLDSLLPEQDPYASYPHLNAALLSLSHDNRIVIDHKGLQGHAIILKNQPGTFGIDVATCCAVGLTFAVSYTCAPSWILFQNTNQLFSTKAMIFLFSETIK